MKERYGKDKKEKETTKPIEQNITLVRKAFETTTS